MIITDGAYFVRWFRAFSFSFFKKILIKDERRGIKKYFFAIKEEKKTPPGKRWKNFTVTQEEITRPRPKNKKKKKYSSSAARKQK